MTEHKGICIGGPRDGEIYTSTRGPTFEAHLPSETPFNPTTLGWDEPVTSKMVYHHVLFHFGDDTGIGEAGYWVPADKLPMAYRFIYTELTEAYARLAGLMK